MFEYTVIEQTDAFEIRGTIKNWNLETSIMDAKRITLETGNRTTIYLEQEDGKLIPVKEFWCERTLKTEDLTEKENE